MNSEHRRGFSDLYYEMVCGHLRWYNESMRPDTSDDQRHIATLRSDRYETYGRALDQIRLEIEERVYHHSHQHDLGIILRFLTQVNNSELSQRLQEIIDPLGSPEHI